jgi:hypothetical protein
VRHFRSVIRIDGIDVSHRGYDGAMGCIIASQFVSDQPPWFTPLAFEQAAEKPFRRALIATPLHQEINGITVLVDGPPQIVPLSLNGDKDFINVPRVAEASLSFFQFASIIRAKLLAPLSNGFIGDGDTTFGEEFFDFTKTQAESMVEPHGVTDNFRGKPVTLVTGCFMSHAASLPKAS